MKDIRELKPDELAQVLFKKLQNEKENFDIGDNDQRQIIGPRLGKTNRKVLRRILARITEFIEVESGMASSFEEYVNNHEVEHIWANNFERDGKEFDHPDDFHEYRNRIGGLLLLPKPLNASYGSKPYACKLEQYFSQNLLARSLNLKCYKHHPDFKRFINKYNLPFEPIEEFKKKNIDERTELYRQIANRIWNPNDLFD